MTGIEQMREFAKFSSSPVINLEDDMYPPLQEMADIFTIREKLGKKQNKKV